MPPSSRLRLDPEALPGLPQFLIMGVLSLLLFLAQWYLIRMVPTGGAVGFEYMLLMIPLGALVCYLVWLNERIWTISALLGHLFFMVALKKGIGVQELAFSTITMFGMAIWFVKEVAIRRQRIVESGFDLLVLSFVVISTITTFIANRLFEGDLLNYTREWFATYDLLLYFPLKKMLKTRRDVMIVIGAFATIGLIAGFNSLFTYRERLLNSVYQYQIESSRVFANETTAMLFMLMFATLFAYSRGFFGRLASFAGMGLGALFLGVSFARGAIVTGIFGMLLLSVLLPLRRGRRVLVALVGSIVAITGLLLIFTPALVGNFARAMEMRLATVARAGTDHSFNARVVESNRLMKYVSENPLLGYGYGVLFKFDDPILQKTLHAGYIHNGYVRPLYKFGIPLALLVYLMMVYPLIRLLIRHPNRRNEPFLWGISAGSASYLVSVIVLNYTTEVFSVFWSVVNFTVVWAVLDYVNRELGSREAILLPERIESPRASGPRLDDAFAPEAG